MTGRRLLEALEHKRKTKKKLNSFKGRMKEAEQEQAQAGEIIRDLRRENKRLKKQIELLQQSHDVAWSGSSISPASDGIFLTAEAAMALLRERQALQRLCV